MTRKRFELKFNSNMNVNMTARHHGGSFKYFIKLKRKVCSLKKKNFMNQMVKVNPWKNHIIYIIDYH